MQRRKEYEIVHVPDSRYEHLAVLNKHKLTDDDYKTGVLTRFEGKYNAGAQQEVL